MSSDGTTSKDGSWQTKASLERLDRNLEAMRVNVEQLIRDLPTKLMEFSDKMRDERHREIERVNEDLCKRITDAYLELDRVREEFNKITESGARTRNAQVSQLSKQDKELREYVDKFKEHISERLRLEDSALGIRIHKLENKELVTETKRAIYWGFLVAAGSVGGSVLTMIFNWLLK